MPGTGRYSEADYGGLLVTENRALRAENERLRRIIDMYGRHEDDCPAWGTGPCECGWEACTPPSGPTLEGDR